MDIGEFVFTGCLNEGCEQVSRIEIGCCCLLASNTPIGSFLASFTTIVTPHSRGIRLTEVRKVATLPNNVVSTKSSRHVTP